MELDASHKPDNCELQFHHAFTIKLMCNYVNRLFLTGRVLLNILQPTEAPVNVKYEQAAKQPNKAKGSLINSVYSSSKYYNITGNYKAGSLLKNTMDTSDRVISGHYS
jgi:hypothetical protein